MKSILQWTFFFACSLALLGCKDDLRTQFDEEYHPPSTKLPKRTQATTPVHAVRFVYSPTNKRDPFRFPHSHIEKTPIPPNKPPTPISVVAPKHSLEHFELDSLRVVATITSVANPMAMIEIPDGNRGFIARRGTLIGRNNGRITRIHNDGIVVSEVKRSRDGRRFVHQSKLRIQRKDIRLEGFFEVGGRKLTPSPKQQTHAGSTSGVRHITR